MKKFTISSVLYTYIYILVTGTITIDGAGVDYAAKRFCASIMDCISRINNAQINHAKDLDVVMPMYNLIEYSDNYSNKVAIL